MKRKDPRFKVGQVVKIIGRDGYVCIREVELWEGRIGYVIDGSEWIHQTNLRHLTKRERGDS